MDAVLIGSVALLIVVLVCSAFFSSSETAIFSLNPIQIHRLRKTHPQAADRLQTLLAHPTKLLATILVGNTLVNVTASGLGYMIAERLVANRGEIIAIPVMTVILLIFGEATPKRFAMAHAERLAALYSHILPTLVWILTPLRAVVENAARVLRKELRAPSRKLSEDEFLSVIHAGEEHGVIKRAERTMVDGIIRLEEMQASQVMTPRVDLIGIDLLDSPEVWLQTALRVQFHYLPIYRKTIDHPEGFLDVPRFLVSKNHSLEEAKVEPFFVPETARLDHILMTFQEERRRVAFVADEYGGTAGIITLGDILEEIVGDMDTEFGVERLTIQRMGTNLWIVDGSTSLKEINHELGTHLEAEGVDRISGWITAQLNRMARTGEAVEAQGCRVTVHRTRKTRILTVFIEKLPAEVAPEGSPA